MCGIWGCASLTVFAVAMLSGSGARALSVPEAHALIEEPGGDPSFVVLDVRTPGEYAAGHIAGAVNIDYRNPSFAGEVEALDPMNTYLVSCRTGFRSAGAAGTMAEKGFSDLYILKGGITAWAAAGHPLIRSV
ncbi:MAG: hypothetical protein PWP08_211 [Methanofollis sp.]|nr:hypothetical protein [Methanofollis sp.]